MDLEFKHALGESISLVASEGMRLEELVAITLLGPHRPL
jgi:hypothetical protein